MREIEFRGISQLDGNWVYGDFQRERIFDKSGERYFYSIGVINEGDWTNRRNVIPVFEQTISQFTGLKDKNGTKIFEDDIVEVDTVANAKIIWNNEDACFAFDYGKRGRPLCLDLIDDASIEVIGNIYDNPELLEVEDE
ncbi:MAG: YopX family protein [Christensenellales bacterium]